jgi:hypothetical protein
MARRQDTEPPDRVTIGPTQIKQDYDFKTTQTDVPLLNA